MRTRFKILLSLLISMVLLGSFRSLALAYDLPDLDRNGSISVTMQDPKSGEAVGGGTLTFYQVGSVQIKDGCSFVLTKDYEGSGFVLDDLESADLSEKLKAYTEANGIKGIMMKIDDDGKATLTELPLGVYLVVQTEAAAGYDAVNPFIVSVPILEEEGYVYDIDASPKIALEKEIPVTPPPEEKLPQTGQLNWPIPLLAMAGLMVFAIGWHMYYVKREEENEA